MEVAMSRKSTRLSGFLAVGLLIASACTGSSNGGTSKGAAATFPKGQVTFTFWNDAEKTMNDLFTTTIIPGYEKLHPNVKIDYQVYATSDVITKVLTAVATHTAPPIIDVPGFELPV